MFQYIQKYKLYIDIQIIQAKIILFFITYFIIWKPWGKKALQEKIII